MIASHRSVGKILDRGDVLDAGVADHDVHRTERLLRLGDHPGDLVRLGHVRRVVGDPHAALRRQAGALVLDRGRVAEAVQHEVGPGGAQGPRDAKADAAGGTGDHGHLALEAHAPTLLLSLRCGRLGGSSGKRKQHDARRLLRRVATATSAGIVPCTAGGDNWRHVA